MPCKRCGGRRLAPNAADLRDIAGHLMHTPVDELYRVAGIAAHRLQWAAAHLEGLCHSCMLDDRWAAEDEWKAAKAAAANMTSEGGPAQGAC